MQPQTLKIPYLADPEDRAKALTSYPPARDRLKTI